MNATATPGVAPIATVTFPNFPPGTVLPTLVPNSASINTLQTLSFPGNLTGGTFTVSFNGATSGPHHLFHGCGRQLGPGIAGQQYPKRAFNPVDLGRYQHRGNVDIQPCPQHRDIQTGLRRQHDRGDHL